jgi:wyosine [tRNA(Phe)-imidazoG37] synthetase (radical SAM superfamily)
MLAELVEGDFMQSSVPAGLRQLNDIALSGNGEPTASPQFGEAIEIVGRQSSRFGLANSIKTVLITNGSQLTKPAVLTTLDALSALNGEIWLKVDRAPVDGFSWVNQVSLKADQLTRHLVSASSRCRTWVQTCMFALDGFPPDEAEVRSYLQLLANAKQEGADLAGVLLYGIARPSTQPEASRLTNAPEAWMRALADRIEALGLPVKLTL